MKTGERIHLLRQRLKERRDEIGTPLEENELISFEARARIRLPEDYRQFLRSIGNGGFGPPGYGLVPLEWSLYRSDVDDPDVLDKDDARLNPHLPFPVSEGWCWLNSDGYDTWKDGDPRFDLYKSVFRDGHLFLGTNGCLQDWLLVTTGPHRGTVWFRTEAEIIPLSPQRSFLEWYEGWLDGV